MKTKNRLKKHITPELIFLVYFWGFAFLRPLIITFPEYSTAILILFAFSLLSISFLMTTRRKVIIKNYALIMLVLSVIFFDVMFRMNSYTLNYLYDFVIYGIIPIHLISQISSFERVVNQFSIFSSVMFIIFASDPIFDYRVFNDYMNYGFLFALPSYMGIHIGRKYLGHKWMFILEIISLFCLVIFSNRSVLLSLFLFIVTLEIIHVKITAKKLARIVLSSFVVVFPLIYIEQITNWLSIKLSNYGIYSYSILHIDYFFRSNNIDKLFSGRLSIWENAKILIADNLLFGSGTGVFQAINGVYTHNLYYDLMVQYGIIGLLFYGFLILISGYKVFSLNGNKRLFGVIFLFLWFPKLFLSVYFYKDISFWIFLAIGNIRELNSYKCDREKTNF